MKNKTKRFITFGLLSSLVLTMINPTYLTSVGIVYAADSYTVQYEDFTDDGNGVLTNFSGDIGSASVVEFPASLTYTTTDDKGTPDDTSDDETSEHTITPTYGSGIFNADSLAQKTFKFADGVKIGVKMQDTVATRIEFAGDVNLIDVTAESYFANNKNIDTVIGCGFLFSGNNSSAMQFSNSSVKHVSFEIPSSVVSSLKASLTFNKTTLESLSISGGLFKDVSGIFSEATITKDVLANLLDHVDSGVISGLSISRFLQNASVSGFDTQKELIDYVSSKVSSVASISSAFDTKVPEQGTTLDLSSFKMQSGSSGSQLMVIENSANYSKYILPEFSGSRYITSSKDIYRFNDDKTLTCVKGSSTENITVNSKETILMNAATVNIHANTTDTKYLSSIYTFAEVLGTDTKYTTTEGGTEEFDMTQKPELNQTYDLYKKPESIEPEVPSDVEIDTGDMTAETTVKYSDNTTGTVADGTIKFTFTEKEDSSIPAPAKKYTEYLNAVVRDITPSIGNKNITELGSSVTITEELPSDYNQTKNGGIKVLNFHDGVNADPIETDATVDLTNGTFSYTVDRFSTYVLLYNTTAENMTNWTATLKFDDSNNEAGARPTSLTMHIYVNDVAYTTKDVTISGDSVNVTVSVPETVADSTAEVTWDLDGAGGTDIASYTGPVESTVSGIKTYTWTYTDNTVTLPIKVNFASDSSDTSTRPATISVTTVATYDGGATNTYTTQVTPSTTSSRTTTYLTYDTEDEDGNALVSLVSTFPNVTDYTISAESPTGTTEHTVTYTYDPDAGTTEYTLTAVFKNDTSSTGARPATITATSVIKYEDGNSTTNTNTINVTTSTTTFTGSFEYDNEYALTSSPVSSVTTTWSSSDGYTVTESGDLYGSTGTYTYSPKATMSVAVTFNDESNEYTSRPTSMSVPVTITYADKSTTTLTASINMSTLKGTVEYSSVNSNGSAAESATSTWPTLTGYNSATIGDSSLTSQTASYSLMYWNETHSIVFTGDSSDTSYRPSTVSVTVTGEYENGNVYENTFDVAISKATTTFTASIPTYYNGSTYSSVTVETEEVTNYELTESAKKHTYKFDTSTDSKKLTYTVKFSDSSNSSGIRPSSLDVTLVNTSDSSDTITSTLTISDATTTTTESYTGTATKTKVGNTYKISKVAATSGASGKFDSYTVTYSDLTATLSYTPETTTISLKATWTDDGDNTDGTRPSSVTVTIKNGDTTVTTATLNSDNSWAKDVSVNKYLKGVEAKYTVTFSDVSNYSKSVSDTTATYKFTGTLSTAAAAKQAAIDSGTTSTTDTEDHTYDIEYFDWIDYANRYPDLKKAFGYNKEQLYAHYIHYGIGEHRIATWTGKYANVNEDILAAYFPDDYKYKTDLTSASDSKYSDITGDTSGTTTSKSGDTTVTTDADGNTVIKQNNGDGTTTETILDENGEVLSTRTYATGDARTELLYVFYIIVLAIAGIIIGLCSTDIIKINKNRKKAISLIHTID